jgi:hypothetical protein
MSKQQDSIKYTIIEDCSPYYIRFKWDGLIDIIKYVSDTLEKLGNNAYQFTDPYAQNYSGYSHCNFNDAIAEKIIDMLPMSCIFEFKKHRVAMFNSNPGGGSGIHKDGSNCRISLNIPIEVHDRLCVTSWYNDEIFVDKEIAGLPYTRNVHRDYRSLNQFPTAKQMTASLNEMILFNTDIFHSWDNTNSPNSRKVLTLRIINHDDLKFEDIKKILFKY